MSFSRVWVEHSTAASIVAEHRSNHSIAQTIALSKQMGIYLTPKLEKAALRMLCRFIDRLTPPPQKKIHQADQCKIHGRVLYANAKSKTWSVYITHVQLSELARS